MEKERINPAQLQMDILDRANEINRSVSEMASNFKIVLASLVSLQKENDELKQKLLDKQGSKSLKATKGKGK